MEKFAYKKAAGITALSASFSDFKYKKHCHEEFAIGVTLRGIQQYHMDGMLQTSQSGGIMIFAPGQVHDGMSHDKSGIDYVMLYIDTHLLSCLTGSGEPVGFPSPVVYNGTLRQNILSVAHAIFQSSEEDYASGLLVSLADCLMKAPEGKAAIKGGNMMVRAKEMLRSRIDRPVSLDEISREVHLSKYQLIRFFKADTGISPYQFYLNCKVEKAKHLIEKSRDIYLAVAECGFVDLTHMNRHFKSRYGVTAFEYLAAIH